MVPAELEAIPGKTYWLIMAGRGWGKTRVGAETTRRWVRQGHRYVNLIGATADDARDIMVEGESGILAVCPHDERPRYVPSKRRLEWPNGAESLIFTADEPERLRGKQHERVWADETGSWRYPEAWDQAQFGLRLGKDPRAIITTTPRPNKLIREIMNNPATIVTRGATYDNRSNLAPAFFESIITKYEGTRIGRQELNGEYLEDNPGALFQRGDIDAGRVKNKPDLRRIVIAVDPAVTSNPDSDETGITAGGISFQGDAYILGDHSVHGSPETWARAAVKAYYHWEADRIVAEKNNGGDMVESVIKGVDPNVPVKLVSASRGKAIRAEPVAALYEQHRVHHVGSFPELEDQMCEWDPTDSTADSPDRMDSLVWLVTELCVKTANTATLDHLRNLAAAHEAAQQKAQSHG